MYIQDILSTEQSEYVSSLTKKSDKDNDAESSVSSPLSWGADTVSISAEARAAQQSAAAGDQNTGESEEEGEEEFTKFGEPTMDGLPIGVSAQNDYGTATAEPDNNQQRGVAPPPMPVSDPVTPSNNDQPVSSSPPTGGNY